MPHLPADDHAAFSIQPMDLKHLLGEIKTDDRYRLHLRLL